MTERMNILQKENKSLRQEITRQLADITSIITEADGRAKTGISSIVNELSDIIPALSREMNNMLDAMSKNADTLQKNALKNFEAEVNRFIKVINTSCTSLEKAANEQSKALTSVAGTVQSVMETGAKDIQNVFVNTRKALQETVNRAMEQIASDYQAKMKDMFEAMADNLAAITQKLRSAASDGESEKNITALKAAIHDMTNQLKGISTKLDTITGSINLQAQPEETASKSKGKKSTKKKSANETQASDTTEERKEERKDAA